MSSFGLEELSQDLTLEFGKGLIMPNTKTNVVDDLLLAVAALKESDDQTIAIKHMETELQNLKTILPFVVTAGADVTKIKKLVIELAKELDIELASKSKGSSAVSSQETSITKEVFVKLLAEQAKGKAAKKNKAEIQRAFNCFVTSKDLKSWVDGNPNIKSEGKGAAKGYYWSGR